VSLLAWAVFARLWYVSAASQRPALLACLVYATAGEVFLSLAWGLYDYRLGNIPLFVPPGHVLLFFLGTQLASRLPDGAEWWITAASLPVRAPPRDTPPLPVRACMARCPGRDGSTMLVLSLAMELWGRGWAPTSAARCPGSPSPPTPAARGRRLMPRSTCWW
jgi:hypothetical protein